MHLPALLTLSDGCSNRPSGARPRKISEGNDYKKFVAVTIAAARDVELTSWGADVAMFLRLIGGQALYFIWNYNVPGGRLGIGIVTGLVEGREFEQNGTYYEIWGAKLSDVAPSYSPSNTNKDVFTFGASGFDVYLKYNGAELVRFKEYRHLKSGVIALQANNNYGFRDVGVHYLVPRTLLSTPESGVIDLRDFGLRDIATRGSIDANENILAIEENKGIPGR